MNSSTEHKNVKPKEIKGCDLSVLFAEKDKKETDEQSDDNISECSVEGDPKFVEDHDKDRPLLEEIDVLSWAENYNSELKEKFWILINEVPEQPEYQTG